MEKKEKDLLQEYMTGLPEGERALLETYFADLKAQCLLRQGERKRMLGDFENAVLYYGAQGVPLRQTLELLDGKKLGGFYARTPVLWFPLDDAAKIYPIAMGHGTMALFRMSACMKAPVVPQLLQIALHFTIRRFPTFATTLKKGIFWHYLDTTKRRFGVEPEQDIPCQPLRVSGSGSPAFRVLYYENRISVEFFHVLTDGTGGMTFLKSLVTEYVRLTGTEVPTEDSFWDAEQLPVPEEFENAFQKVPKAGAASGFVEKAALQLGGRLSNTRPCRVLHFKMDAQALREAARKRNVTVTAYLLARMFVAAKASIEELEGEIGIQVPVNMRKFYPSRTVRNFAMYGIVRLPVARIATADEIQEEVSAQMGAKTSREAMDEMVSATRNLVTMLRYIPLAIKQPVAKVVYGFLGDKVFTTALSNLGVVELPQAVARQVESMDFVLGTAITNRVSCAMVTVNGVACFSMAKMTADPSFEEALYDQLTADGIPVNVEGSGYYGY